MFDVHGQSVDGLYGCVSFVPGFPLSPSFLLPPKIPKMRLKTLFLFSSSDCAAVSAAAAPGAAGLFAVGPLAAPGPEGGVVSPSFSLPPNTRESHEAGGASLAMRPPCSG